MRSHCWEMPVIPWCRSWLKEPVKRWKMHPLWHTVCARRRRPSTLWQPTSPYGKNGHRRFRGVRSSMQRCSTCRTVSNSKPGTPRSRRRKRMRRSLDSIGYTRAKKSAHRQSKDWWPRSHSEHSSSTAVAKWPFNPRVLSAGSSRFRESDHGWPARPRGSAHGDRRVASRDNACPGYTDTCLRNPS